MAYQGFAGTAWASPWVRHERLMKTRWLEAMAVLPADSAVAIVSAHPRGPDHMEDICAQAQAILGDRCFCLREPEFGSREFWMQNKGKAGDPLFHDLRDAMLAQGVTWNKEEMETLFHARICAMAFFKMVSHRRMRLDLQTVECEGWGEEFEGCTAKYTLAFRKVMGLARPVELNFDMCMPGAKFVLNPKKYERIALSDELRLFLFQTTRGPIGLFISTQCTLADRANRVRLPKALQSVVVRGKQGIRIWPRSQMSKRKPYPLGYEEPEQTLVVDDPEGIQLPVCAGMIYRWAKAPAYVFAPRGMTPARFKALMKQAIPVET
jgi:hypothetical protein